MKSSDELFSEVGGKGSVSHAFAVFSYRYDDLIVRFSEWPDIEFSKITDVGRALKKRHPGKTTILPGSSATHLDDREFAVNTSTFDDVMINALRVLGVSDGEIDNVKVYEGSMGGEYRKPLRNAAFYGERYLVGKSLLQHHNPFLSTGTNYDMDDLSEELVDTARSVAVSTRDRGNVRGCSRMAVEGLSRAIDAAKTSRST